MTTSALETQRPSDLLIREPHALWLREAADGGDGVFNPDGTIDAVILRPCLGRGPGKRIYTQAMLRENAEVFGGWPSYIDHESPTAKRARMGLPRGLGELGGEIRESWWDADFTTPEDGEAGFEQGAVLGRIMPSEEVEKYVRRFPRLVKMSVNAAATALTPGTYKGRPGSLVEGIVDDPENCSVDFVTLQGAGGHVRTLLESQYSGSQDDLLKQLEGVDDDELTAHLREHRPELLEALDIGGSGVTMKLQEALQDESFKSELDGYIREQSKSLVETAITEHDSQRDEREARQRELGQLAGTAKTLIESSRLPNSFQADLLERYALRESGPTPELDIYSEVDPQSGEVTKTADAKLREQLSGDDGVLTRERNKLREAGPTLPGGAGPLANSGGDDGGQPSADNFGKGSDWAKRAAQAGLNLEYAGVAKESD